MPEKKPFQIQAHDIARKDRCSSANCGGALEGLVLPMQWKTFGNPIQFIYCQKCATTCQTCKGRGKTSSPAPGSGGIKTWATCEECGGTGKREEPGLVSIQEVP